MRDEQELPSQVKNIQNEECAEDEDKSSFGNPGNRMQLDWRYCRCGADPRKNGSERAGASSSSLDNRRDVSAANGCCINAEILSNSELEISQGRN